MRALFALSLCSLTTTALGCIERGWRGGELAAQEAAFADAIAYRDDLDEHPGCSVEGLAYQPAVVDGFRCAARDLTTSEDPALPIVILVHGNSDSPRGWLVHESEACQPPGATQGAPMLAERLAERGHRVLALDLRTDLVDDPAGNNDTENTARNMDHGWGTPLLMHLLARVLDAYPERQVSLVGFSFGVTVVRDALRRLDVNDGARVWPRIDDVILLAGGNHGVSTYALCGANPTMRGQVTCELGDRAAYTPTAFLAALNGPGGAFESPCGDDGIAYGRDVCEGHVVEHTTVVMQDLPDGTQQDLFVSEASAALAGATNHRLELNDFDESDYFFCGLFKNHYGAARSLAALELVLDELAD